MDTRARFKWRNAYRAGRVAAFVHRRASYPDKAWEIFDAAGGNMVAARVVAAIFSDDALARKPSRMFSSQPGMSILRRVYTERVFFGRLNGVKR